MNRYLCAVRRYSGESIPFEVSATDKEDALFVAKQYIERNYNKFGANYAEKSIRVVSKIETVRGE